MVKRIRAKSQANKAKKRAAPSRKKTIRPKKNSDKIAIDINRKAQWEAYKNLQRRVDDAWDELKKDIQRKANPKTLVEGKNRLLLLLGECNYMARECMRIMEGNKRRN